MCFRKVGVNFFFHGPADDFNKFIDDSKLWDVLLGGHLFTWISSKGEKLRKLDRFLITDDLMGHVPNLKALDLGRMVSYHKPIVLKQFFEDFGPIPFKFYNS